MSVTFRLFALVLVFFAAGCALGPKDTDGDAFLTAVDTPHTIDLTQDPDDVWVRIRRGFAIPNLNTPLVQEWTDYYARHATSVLTMSERASKYLYFIVEELERRGMPTELALLPFVESAFNPTAYSRAHASGLWQFIPSTGKHFNLRQDPWLDERRDPVASTHAALDYLTYLFDYQGDWFLALASYNWGEGAVRRAIEKNESQDLGTDYLSLKMPDETRNYVPKLQAIKNIIANPIAYNIQLPKVNNEPYFTVVHGPSHMDIEIAAALAEMPLEEFKFLNPAYQKEIIPQDRPTILLPKPNARLFKTNLASYDGKLSRWDIYEARAGESYQDIAEKFDMSLSQLKQINHLGKKNQQATSGQTLFVAARPADEPLDELPATEIADTEDSNAVVGVQVATLDEVPTVRRSSVTTAAAPNNTSTKLAARPSTKAAANVPAHAPTNASDTAGTAPTGASSGQAAASSASRALPSGPRYHVVKQGDTLYSLARRYSTSVQAIQQLNHLNNHRIPLGKRLLIPS